ncbi:dof zinc finger protein [Musa troglodytarum]|uniref:Large ribosomal subunit protein uL29m n=1 Tax=Musa troglodytarum TaxID=320322 RepID=A0A9E7F798_9LILI|nr:dof zinc finger protein [Musa troglodytarum]
MSRRWRIGAARPLLRLGSLPLNPSHSFYAYGCSLKLRLSGLQASGVFIMFTYRVLGRVLCAAARSESSAASSSAAAASSAASASVRKAQNPLEEFFEVDRDTDEEKPVIYGCSWKACELRLKSWDDLQKLWCVLLKEKNMLMTQSQMLHAQNLRFPNPERIPKVRKSTCRIKHVLTERAIAEPDPRRSAEIKRMINAL